MHKGREFEAVRSELESWLTNEDLMLGGEGMVRAAHRLFGGRAKWRQYVKAVGDTRADAMALINAAYEAAGEAAKN